MEALVKRGDKKKGRPLLNLDYFEPEAVHHLSLLATPEFRFLLNRVLVHELKNPVSPDD